MDARLVRNAQYGAKSLADPAEHHGATIREQRGGRVVGIPHQLVQQFVLKASRQLGLTGCIACHTLRIGLKGVEPAFADCLQLFRLCQPFLNLMAGLLHCVFGASRDPAQGVEAQLCEMPTVVRRDQISVGQEEVNGAGACLDGSPDGSLGAWARARRGVWFCGHETNHSAEKSPKN